MPDTTTHIANVWRALTVVSGTLLCDPAVGRMGGARWGESRVIHSSHRHVLMSTRQPACA